ncbi:MAG: LON peptidase substrate-binding domain-containing protein [Gammaproteobacteria bacterium]
MTQSIPLFPLNTVLFPGGVLPLRIFEPRYLDMISDCLKTDSGIGVVLIRNGREVGELADTFDIGTLTHIRYWHKRPDGLLGVTLQGEQRFRILSTDVRPNQLLVAEVELLPEPPFIPVAAPHQQLVDLLKQIIKQLEPPYTTLTPSYENASWVSARLVELLPFDLLDKQKLLMTEDAGQRLDTITTMLHKMDIL